MAGHELEKLKQFLLHGCIEEEAVPEDALKRICNYMIGLKRSDSRHDAELHARNSAASFGDTK